MATEIGTIGLAEVNLTIPQGTSLEFTINHEDEDGNPVDHSAADIRMAFQSKDKTRHMDLSQYCSGTETGVSVFIPASFTADIPIGKLLWDMISETENGTFRLAYGTVRVVDTYALDGE